MKLFCVSRAVKHLLDPLLHLGIIIMVIVLMTRTIVTILMKGAPGISRRSQHRRPDQEASLPEMGAKLVKVAKKC